MDEIITFMKDLISSPTFQGVLAMITSAGFIGLLTAVLKLLGNKRVSGYIAQMKESMNDMKKTIDGLNEELDHIQTKIDEANENAATSKEMTKTYILNSKASASTKNEVLRIDAEPQSGEKPVKAAEPIKEYVDEPQPKTEEESIDELVNQL